MSDLNDINRSLGNLEGKMESLTEAVTSLTTTVQSLQQSKWTSKGVLLGLAALSGGAGSKIAEFLGMTGGSPPQH